MNSDTLEGQARTFGGDVKEAAGTIGGDSQLRAEGRGDQVAGNVQQSIGAAGDAVSKATRPILDTVRQTARDKPIATYAAAGLIGAAILRSVFNRRRGA